MSDEKKSVPIQVMFTPSQLQTLDDWRSGSQIWSRGEAIRQLVFSALEARGVKVGQADKELRRRESQAVGKGEAERQRQRQRQRRGEPK